MIHTQPDFYNKLASQIAKEYFPTANDKNIEGVQLMQVKYQIELFNNGCLTYRQLIGRLSKRLNNGTIQVHHLVSKYIVSFGSYTYKPTKYKS